jgi:glycosyltransferase involved in cell wall biosynthesis
LPSFSEGLPQVVFEAMSQGTVVVATKVGGIPLQIEHGINGLLFNPGEEEEFKEIFCDITKGKFDLMQIRKNALVVAAKYCFERQSDIIFEKIN